VGGRRLPYLIKSGGRERRGARLLLNRRAKRYWLVKAMTEEEAIARREREIRKRKGKR